MNLAQAIDPDTQRIDIERLQCSAPLRVPPLVPLADPARDSAGGFRRGMLMQKILELLAGTDGPLTTVEVAEALDVRRDNAAEALRKLADRGDVIAVGLISRNGRQAARADGYRPGVV